MNTRRTWAAVAVIFLASVLAGPAQQQLRVQDFSPQGTISRVRQVRAHFSGPMVSFGDPRAASPFDISCPEKGTGRWADAQNWIYDFDRDLPAGVRCEFTLKEGLRGLDGNTVAGQRRFQFSTGGPAIIHSIPYQGSEDINDDQVFILQLNGPAVTSSVAENVSFSVEGLSELAGIRIVTGEEREAILDSVYSPRNRQARPEHLLLIQARQRFPASSRVNLIWGAGVLSPSGVATDQDQVLPFRTRSPFTASFHCRRENPEAHCVPISPMTLMFSSPVSWKTAQLARLQGPGARVWTASPDFHYASQGEDQLVSGVKFNPPFPENASFTVEIPAGIVDEQGNPLVNADRFPLEVKTDEYPPLAKFAADFGILELKSDPVLPVTLRNIEPELSGRVFETEGGEENFDPIPVEPGFQPLSGTIDGKLYKIPPNKANQMLAWIQIISRRNREDRGKSIFGPLTASQAKSFKLPKPAGSKPFEVVGIPFTAPGFYVVELESEILGASLLGRPGPMYVPAAVLVTNLSVHFKWGADSSLIWVTSLDKGKPVKQAKVEVRNCEGTMLWQGVTDGNGVGRIDSLPKPETLPYCPATAPGSAWSFEGGGLLATAELKDDMAFVHSSWDKGIESWRFGIPVNVQPQLQAAHTILDRSLFRAGETVHMKHVLRRKDVEGFSFMQPGQEPHTAVIRHFGSDQKYEIPLKWDSAGIAETVWSIPKEARLGNYGIFLELPARKRREWDGEIEYTPTLDAGSFRVEEFRVPLMRATIRPPSEPLVNPTEIPVDLTISYLSSGGAGALPVKFRYDIRPRYIGPIEGFDSFVFSNGSVREGIFRQDAEPDGEPEFNLTGIDLTLDRLGSARTTITDLPRADRPMQVQAELEFRDPNGEVQTASSSIPLWSAARLVGIRPDTWMQSGESLAFKVAVVDLNQKPVAHAHVSVDAFQRKVYSHRKRLAGGFYAYENYTEVKRIGPVCSGNTNGKGLLICSGRSAVSGEVILQATTQDEAGRRAVANISTWIAGEEDWWFAARDDDRMDVLPEKKHYEPGEKARFQVRMPFRTATALISVEREGVADVFVRELSGKEPVIEIPVKGGYAPNIFVSVLAVRGRVNGPRPTATVDLNKPAYKLGIAEINVGWKAHELQVRLSTDRQQYKAREKAKVQIAVTMPDGRPPAKGAEVALAAVDEGLLELMPNSSWQLLDAMMGRRSCSVQTSTAQMHVVGKRHFGLKALPQGGGGGSQITRELFDTLLLWRGRVPLDEKGQAAVEVPLNDSITSFRIAAVATAGEDRFGTGSTSIRSTRDLILFSGVAPVVREGDRYRSTFTLRNTTERALNVRVAASISRGAAALAPQSVALGSGESREISWDVTAPAGAEALTYTVEADAGGGITDRLSVTQKVVPAVPVRAFQATLTQLEGDYRLAVERPREALPGTGGVSVSLKPKLVEGMTGVTEYMQAYPYTCLEQVISKAIALNDAQMWSRIAAALPAYVDGEGLLKYFPSMPLGSDVLTAYVLAISRESGREIPPMVKGKMIEGLRGFVEGRVIRHSTLPTVDLAVRKLSALAALSSTEATNAVLLSSIAIQPNLWPTSAVIDWMEILQRSPLLPDRDARLLEAEQILRARINYQGSVMSFSTEATDCLWWLMVSPDENAVRLILRTLNSPGWRNDIPKMVRGALARHKQGRWDTTVANAWGVLAMRKFSDLFEKTPVTGTTAVSLADSSKTLNWAASAAGGSFSFPWPGGKPELVLQMNGTGRPWATIRSLAAIPLKEPFSSGFRINKSLIPLEQKNPGRWTRGDLVRVRLELEAQADMTWVVVNDPIPAGSTILGSGLGRDSRLATRGEKNEGWVWPAFEERSFEAFRAYYEFVPKGRWAVEYTVRINNEGTLNLPPTRVEALYAPEMFGERPNEPFQVN